MTLRTTMLLLTLVLVSAGGWHVSDTGPACERRVRTPHFIIHSNAGAAQTDEIACAAETLYRGFGEVFGRELDLDEDHPRLEVILYADREQFRAAGGRIEWAEAYYSYPYCHLYYAEGEENPLHWMVHEGVHQLCGEVAGVRPPRWLGEGLACYFATSRIEGQRLLPGEIDPATYPAWWLPSMDLTGDREADIAAGRFLPLAVIVGGEGGPGVDQAVNLYYLHWWSLAHYLMEGNRGGYRAGVAEYLRAGRDGNFDAMIGPTAEIEPLWYQHLLGLKAGLAA